MKLPEFTYDETLLLLCLYFEFNFLDFSSINKERLKYRISVYSRIFRILNAHNINLFEMPEYRNVIGIELQIQSIRKFHLSLEGMKEYGISGTSSQFKSILHDSLNGRIDLVKEKSRIFEKLILEKCTENGISIINLDAMNLND